MDSTIMPNQGAMNMGEGTVGNNGAQVDHYKTKVDELFTQVDKLELRVNEIEQFYINAKLKESNTSGSPSMSKDKEKEKNVPSMKKLQLDASRRDAAAAKRMQELMRQFGSIFRQITQHKLAWPFMQPVDVEGLGLDDYYQIIDRPMDFSTIKNQMEAKDGTRYKHVREVCADVRLVFKNAMKYNDEKSDVHGMAKALLDKFEEKWLQLLPKVMDEEKRREEEEAEAQKNILLVQEAAHAKMARDLNNELQEIDNSLEELREMVVKKCRRMSTMEKRRLGSALAKLCPEDLSKALDIVAQKNSNFQPTADEVELDISSQRESTLWRLKFFVKDVQEGRCGASTEDKNDNATIPPNVTSRKRDNNIVSRRKQEISNALAKTSKRRKRGPSS